MRNVVRAIIIKDNSLLTIKRIKNDKTYWVFPGGGVEGGENHTDALIRECKEELGVEVEVLELVFEYPFTNKEFGVQREFFYKCKLISGQLGTGIGLEYDLNSKYVGSYEPVWMKLSEIENLDLKPLELKNSCLLFENKK